MARDDRELNLLNVLISLRGNQFVLCRLNAHFLFLSLKCHHGLADYQVSLVALLVFNDR